MPPDRGREIAPERQPVLDHAVDVTVEELDRLDADHRRAGALLGLAQRSGLVRRHAVDAGSPRVTSRYTTCLPAAVQRAMAPAAPYSRSSGWATMQSARDQSSGNGLRRRAQNDLGDPNTARTRGSKCSSGSVS